MGLVWSVELAGVSWVFLGGRVQQPQVFGELEKPDAVGPADCAMTPLQVV